MKIGQLRETLEHLLGGEPNLLGQYILPNNTRIPALYVTGIQGVPGEWKVDGLEATIGQFPELLSRAMVGSVERKQFWTVMLVNYDTSSSNLQQAAERIIRRFPDARLSFTPESDVVYGQYRIRIPDTDTLRIYPPL